MKVDVIYLCHDRVEFTRATLPNLLTMTDWAYVNNFIIYNDASSDPAVGRFVKAAVKDIGFGKVKTTDFGSPVAVMRHYLHSSRADAFAKIDNDIIVPGGWFTALAEVLDDNPELELLGMEPGMSGEPPWKHGDDPFVRYSYLPSLHIGGVGMMRRSAFQRLPELVPNGRFGFTEWQHQWNPVRGWLMPDLSMFSLDFLPIDPWRSITDEYRKTPGLQRDWPLYDPAMHYYWNWWTG